MRFSFKLFTLPSLIQIALEHSSTAHHRVSSNNLATHQTLAWYSDQKIIRVVIRKRNGAVLKTFLF